VAEARAETVRVGPSLGGASPFVLAAMVLVPTLALPGDSAIPIEPRLAAALLWVCCLWPSWRYTRLGGSRRPPIPFLPLIGLVYGAYFSAQLLAGSDNVLASSVERPVILDPRVDYALPAQLALVGWLCLLAGLHLRRKPRRPAQLFALRDEDADALKPLAFRTLLIGLVAEALLQLGRVPTVLRGTSVFVATVSTVAVALLVMSWARRRLSGRESATLGACLVVQGALRLGSGSVSQIMLLILTAILAAWTAGRRAKFVWLVAGAVALAAGAAIKGVLSDFRREAWFSNVERSLPERTALVSGLLAQKVQRLGVVETVRSGSEVIAARSAATDLLADVARRTPDPVPYWGGETYYSLVGAFVPRFLWPNKPVKDLGQRFGHRYGYLGERDSSTSINFPFLIEFYANFGEIGVILGMLIVGLLYATLERYLNVPGQGPLATAVGLTLLVPLVNIESDFSLVFGGLALNLICLGFLAQAVRGRLRAGSGRTGGRVPQVAAPGRGPVV
jgi:hypothetical protein